MPIQELDKTITELVVGEPRKADETLALQLSRLIHRTEQIAIAEERTRIAQELHDTLLQGFTGISLKLDALTNSLSEEHADLREKLEGLLEQSDKYLTEARCSVLQLRSTTLEKHQSFKDAIAMICARVLAGASINLDLNVTGKEWELNGATQENLLRICQEAVVNALKHGRPKQIEVNVEFYLQGVSLRIRDNGCGFVPRDLTVADGHFGLIGLRERVASIGGSLIIKTELGKGTEIAVHVAKA